LILFELKRQMHHLSARQKLINQKATQKDKCGALMIPCTHCCCNSFGPLEGSPFFSYFFQHLGTFIELYLWGYKFVLLIFKDSDGFSTWSLPVIISKHRFYNCHFQFNMLINNRNFAFVDVFLLVYFKINYLTILYQETYLC
jgi:hypothetical protein